MFFVYSEFNAVNGFVQRSFYHYTVLRVEIKSFTPTARYLDYGRTITLPSIGAIIRKETNDIFCTGVCVRGNFRSHPGVIKL